MVVIKKIDSAGEEVEKEGPTFTVEKSIKQHSNYLLKPQSRAPGTRLLILVILSNGATPWPVRATLIPATTGGVSTHCLLRYLSGLQRFPFHVLVWHVRQLKALVSHLVRVLIQSDQSFTLDPQLTGSASFRKSLIEEFM